MIPNVLDLLPDASGPLKDLLIQEAAEEVLGGPADDAVERRIADTMKEHGFEVVPADAPDSELELKQTASKPAELKFKRQFAEVEDDKGHWDADWSVLGVDVHSRADYESKFAIAEIKLPWPGTDSGGAQVNVADIEGEAALAELETKQYRGTLGELDPVAVLQPAVIQFEAPFAARVGDVTAHGGAVSGPGSPDVLIGGRHALRALDSHTCLACTPAPHGPGLLASGQTNVLINGRPAIRAGDWVAEGVGLNPVTTGCLTVLVGKPPPPLSCTVVAADQRGILEYDLQAGLDLLHAIGKVKAGLDISLQDGIKPHFSYEGDISLFRPWLEADLALNIPLAIDVDLPLLGRVQRDYLTVGHKAELEARVLTAGFDGSLKPGGKVKPNRGVAWIAPGKNKVKSVLDAQKAGEPRLVDPRGPTS